MTELNDNVVCRLCGAEKRELNSHLRAMHAISVAEYRSKFPGAEIISEAASAAKSAGVSAARKGVVREISEETRRKIGERSKEMHARLKAERGDAYLEQRREIAKIARAAKGDDYRHSEETRAKMRKPRPSLVGRVVSQETRDKIAEARRNYTGWSHAPETIEKMRVAWERRRADKESYAAYVASVSERMSSPENLARLRTMMAERIKNGNHNGRSKDTTLEKKFQAFLRGHQLVFDHQFGLEGGTGGTFLYDFHLPSLNMLVEVDGEYWHRKSMEQFNRDRLKEKIATEAGFTFVRISDWNWIPEIIFAEPDVIRINNEEIMSDRTAVIPPAKSRGRRRSQHPGQG